MKGEKLHIGPLFNMTRSLGAEQVAISLPRIQRVLVGLQEQKTINLNGIVQPIGQSQIRGPTICQSNPKCYGGEGFREGSDAVFNALGFS